MSAVNKEVIDRITPWLLSNLHSDDLDAKDMADYVISLISAPGTQEQLYARCKSELEEFLGAQTEPFVNALFQQITQLTQGGNEQMQASQNADQPLSGGQEEFRRNFRGEFPQVPHQQQHPQSSHGSSGAGAGGASNAGAEHANNAAAFPPFPGFPGMPGAQGMPQNAFPPFPGQPQQGIPPQFGFQGFGRPGKFNNAGRGNFQQRQNHQRQNHRRIHSPLASIHNEHSVANRGLVVEQIPAEHLNNESIEQYFGKFGKLTNIKVNEKDSLAEIQFESHDDAVEAHKCPDPIFGNRFVKVFWRRHSAGEEPPELDVEAVRRMQAIKQQQFEEKEAKRKELTASLRAVMNEQAAILQQRQQMLQSGQVDTDQQAQMQARSEELSEKLRQYKQELAALQGSSAQSGPSRGGYRGRGANPYGRGARAPRGSYRGAYSGSFGGPNKFQGASLDRRPKGVLVEGVTPDKDEVLRGELASRNYVDYERKSDNSVLIDFADRRGAEEFFSVETPELGNLKKSWVRVEPKQATPDTTMDE